MARTQDSYDGGATGKMLLSPGLLLEAPAPTLCRPAPDQDPAVAAAAPQLIEH